MNTYSAPDGATAACTRSFSVAWPMNSTRTPLNESGLTPAKAFSMISAIFADSGEPKASRLPPGTPRLITPSTWSFCPAKSSLNFGLDWLVR